jgi:hypothetical protein
MFMSNNPSGMTYWQCCCQANWIIYALRNK